MPMAQKAGLHSAVLTALRRRRGLHSKDLAALAGRDDSLISRLETIEEPSWEILLELTVGAMKYDLEEVESSIYGLSRSSPETLRIPESPIPVTDEEVRAIRRAAGQVGRAFTDAREEILIRELRAAKVREARKEAEELCRTLLQAKGKMRLVYIETGAEYRTWAVAERLCELSEEAAGRLAQMALELAELARRVAELMPGEEAWRARVLGFCLAFLANAWRVAGEQRKAAEIFVSALDQWNQGEAGDPERILPAWRMADLQASLKRDLREFGEAMRLHDEARSAAPRVAWGRILVKKACTYDQMYEPNEAIQVLEEAAPFVEEVDQPRLRFQAACLMAVNLCHLGHYREAEDWVRRAYSSGIDWRNELELVRARWLSGRVAAGLGQIEKALESFRAVRHHFEREEIAYDYALASLEEARLLNDLGEYRKVQEMVLQDMDWIFRKVQIHREAMVALMLFRDAVEGERATAELTQRVHEYLVRAEKNPDLHFTK